MKNFLKNLLIVALELALISGALWFVALKKGITSPSQFIPALKQAQQVAQNIVQKPEEKPFPVESGAVKKTYVWIYKGIKYSLTETLYDSSFQFYQGQPKTYAYFGALPKNWENDYYGMFLKSNVADNFVDKLATDLQQLGQKHGLSDDQIVEMTLAFVQTIPYDDARAKEILSKNGDVKMQYPYETLYLNSGVCSDKSLLATAILRQMGYGTALFAYEDDNHMAIGIQCPKDSSTYGSGYCYGETTAVGNKIGIVPSLDAGSNKPVELANFNTTQQENLRELGQVSFFQQTQGKLYNGLAATEKIIAEISALKKQIDLSLAELQNEQKSVSNEIDQLNNMQKTLQDYRNAQDVQDFNSLVGKYNDSLQNYKNDVKKYNSDVTLYNQAIARYNVLIKQ